MSNSEASIPPPGKRFRLKNYYSNQVLVAKNNEVSDYNQATKFDDQYFTLVPTKENDSFYIKSTYGANEGKVLYSKDGGVGLYTQSDYHDQWFYFEPGQDYLEGNYRLVTRYTNKVIVSKPGISNYHADGAKYDDQYWSFVE